MRTSIIGLSALLSICSGQKPPPPPGGGGRGDIPPPAPPEPEPVLQIDLDTAAGDAGELEGGIRATALAGTTAPGITARIGIEPPETLVGLPHTGAAARIGPVLSVTLVSSTTRPLLVSVPVNPSDLPGGLTVANIHSSRVEDDAWSRIDSLLVETPGQQPRITMAIRESGRYGLLADASRITPSVGSHAESLLALIPLIFGPFDEFASAVEWGDPQKEPDRLYVLDTVVGTLAVMGSSYQLLETKDRNPDGSPRLLAVRHKGGNFETDGSIVAKVLVAQAIRQELGGADRAVLATMLDDNGAHLAARTSDNATLERIVTLIDLTRSKELAIPDDEEGTDTTLEGFDEIMSDETTSLELTGELITLEMVRTRTILENLARELREFDPTSDDGDAILDLGNRLAWALGRIEAIGSTFEEAEEAAVLPAWHTVSEISRPLSPAKKTKKKPALPAGIDTGSDRSPSLAELQALATALSPVDDGGQASIALVWACLDLLGPISTLAGTSSGPDFMSTPDVLLAAAEVAAREPIMAPPPETIIAKHSFKNGKLSVVTNGTDEDGAVKGYRWWFDSDPDAHIIKGKGNFTASLNGLRSGSHDLFVAAIDDDGQRDPTADRISFYVRRTVDVSTKALNIQFDAHPWNVNSEHRRSIKTFVRRLEGPVQECADNNYRWGIDGGGKVTVVFGFSAGKTANTAHSASVEKDTFKNKDLSKCISKTLKQPRMRYNQEYKPAAQVSLTFQMKPSILFFDAESLGGTPGPDAMGAALYLKCTDKAVKKAEVWCDSAVSALPGPWDADSQMIAAGLMEPATSGDEGGDDEPEMEDPESGPEEMVEEAVTLEEAESIVIPHPEFDAIEIHGSCIEENISIFIENCMLHLTKKRLWCTDSCLKKAKSCSKKCNSSEDWGEDPFMCKQICWTEEAIPCAENCAVKQTPFEKKGGTAEW